MARYGKYGTPLTRRLAKKTMFKLRFHGKKSAILCLGAHPDDIEIGCGGTVLRLIRDIPDLQLYWVVFSGDNQRAGEAEHGATEFLKEARSKVIHIEDFRESYFPFIGAEIKDYFESLKKEFSPDLILTHYSNDAHQDHRLISDLTWKTFRDQLILEYEVPKYDGDLGTPNLYVHLDKTLVQRKIKLVCEVFQTQKDKHWFDEETFGSVLRIRGLESKSPSNYAEAFYCRKIVL